MLASHTQPHAEYTRRLKQRRIQAARKEHLHAGIGHLRLVAFLVFGLLAWLSIWPRLISPWWMLAPVAAFIALVIEHDLITRAKVLALRAAAAYERGIARLEHHWAGTGEAGERFHDSAHAYAEDLDLFGRGGLFELLSMARTRMGEDTLAQWLLSPAALPAVRNRQQAVDDLRDRLDLRESLVVLGEDVAAGVHPEPLVAWAEEAPVLVSAAARLAAIALAGLALASAVAWVWAGLRVPLLAVLGAEAAFVFWLRARVRHVVQGVEFAAHDLALLAAVLARIEREPFQAARLVELRAALRTGGVPPSRRIARLNRLVELLDSRDNWFVRIFGPPLLYTMHLAFAVEAWRIHSGPAVRGWLAAVGEFEALTSLAGYAYEHPADPFPEFLDDHAGLEAEGLGHPLLPEARLVRNDVRLGGDLRVLIVSGSNMSGKSTLLRTVGINVVLAMAGAPVRARRLRLSPLAVGASIRVTDSLQAGSSRFYAEITRLKKMLDRAAGPPPLLFLLDELLHGTNSHDRRIGAEGVVRALVERGAIGLLTTHDLALTHIAAALAPGAENVHFEDHLENGRITFDYRLRSGIVRKSNALELMRSIGLEV